MDSGYENRLLAFLLCGFLASLCSADLQTAILDNHNNKREAAGLPPLTWDNNIAAKAQTFADEVLKDNNQCKAMEHSKSTYRATGAGENIFMRGGGSSETADVLGRDASDSWFSEIKDYRFSGDKESYDKCSDFKKVGHFTQMMWKKTTSIGCGYTTCDDNTQFVVCQYFPAGNMQGEPMFDPANFDKMNDKAKTQKMFRVLKCFSAQMLLSVWVIPVAIGANLMANW